MSLLARLQPMVTTFQTEKRHGYSVQFSPFFPQRLACATAQHYGIAGNGRVFVFELIPGRGLEPLRVFDYNNGVFDVAWSESNENVLVTAGGDGALQVWDVTQKQGPLKVLKEHTKEIYGVSWSQTRNEHFVLSASWDQSIKLWDINSDQSLNTFSGHNALVYSAIWSPHFPGCFSSTSADHTLRVWDVRNPQMATTTIPAHNAEILTCDWAKYNENMLFTGSVDCLIRGWDVRRPDVCLCVLRGHEMAVRRVKTSPHLGNILASASYDFTVRTWDMNAGHPLETIEHHTEFVYGLDFNLHVPGQIADCSWDELVRVYSLSSCLPREAP